jgi:hypothetical protein
LSAPNSTSVRAFSASASLRRPQAGFGELLLLSGEFERALHGNLVARGLGAGLAELLGLDCLHFAGAAGEVGLLFLLGHLDGVLLLEAGVVFARLGHGAGGLLLGELVVGLAFVEHPLVLQGGEAALGGGVVGLFQQQFARGGLEGAADLGLRLDRQQFDRDGLDAEALQIGFLFERGAQGVAKGVGRLQRLLESERLERASAEDGDEVLEFLFQFLRVLGEVQPGGVDGEVEQLRRLLRLHDAPRQDALQCTVW